METLHLKALILKKKLKKLKNIIYQLIHKEIQKVGNIFKTCESKKCKKKTEKNLATIEPPQNIMELNKEEKTCHTRVPSYPSGANINGKYLFNDD